MFLKLCERCPKNEFGFDRNAADRRFAAKRMSEIFWTPLTELGINWL